MRREAWLAAGALAVGLFVAFFPWPGRRAPHLSSPRAAEEPAPTPTPDLSRAPEPARAEGKTPIAIDELDARPHAAGGRAALDEVAPIQGQLLDEESGLPIERGVALVLGVLDSGTARDQERVEPGPLGRFETSRAFSRADMRVQVLEARSDELLFTVHRPFDPARPEWVLRVYLRLLVPLDIDGPALALAGLQGRVVVRDPDGTDERAWEKVRGGAAPFLYYQQASELEPDEEAWLELHATAEGGERVFYGRVRLPDAQGALAPVAVALVEEPRVTGTVVDARGRRLVGATAWFLPRAGAGQAWNDLGSETDGDGRFHVEGLQPGRHGLVLARGSFRAAPLEVEIRPGANELGELVLEPPAGGAIRGELVAAGRKEPAALLVLVDLASGERRYALSQSRRLDDDGRAAFGFEPVPPGAYELRPIGILGDRFEPARLAVSPPAEGLEFHAVGARGDGWAFRVRDAENGALLEEFHVLACTEGFWLGWDEDDPVPITAERFVVCAAGHRPLSVGPDVPFVRTAGEHDGERVELRVIEVELERGWGIPVLCRSTEAGLSGALGAYFAPPLAGVRVLLDGILVATSDATGLALVPSTYGRLEVELPGWHTVSSQDEEDVLRIVLLARD